MSFLVTFANETKKYEEPISLLDIVGKDKTYIGCLVNNRIR